MVAANCGMGLKTPEHDFNRTVGLDRAMDFPAMGFSLG
jgi:hypothetical protein